MTCRDRGEGVRSVGRAGRDRSRRLRTGFEPVPRRSERAPGETALLAEYPAGRSRHLRSNLCPDRGLAKKIALLEGRSRTDLHPISIHLHLSLRQFLSLLLRIFFRSKSSSAKFFHAFVSDMEGAKGKGRSDNDG